MRDGDRRDPALVAEADDELGDDADADGVEPGGRLVVEDDLGLEDHGARQPDPLLLPAGELGGVLLQRLLEVHVRHGPLDPVLLLALREVRVAVEVEAHVLLHRHRVEEGAALEEVPDREPEPVELVPVEEVHALALHPHLALVRLEEADDVADEHALPRARAPEHHLARALRDGERDAPEHVVRAEALVDVAELDDDVLRRRVGAAGDGGRVVGLLEGVEHGGGGRGVRRGGGQPPEMSPKRRSEMRTTTTSAMRMRRLESTTACIAACPTSRVPPRTV